ncbi:MAG: PKD domain-containing protein, partial [Dehalococcoidia bacterium]
MVSFINKKVLHLIMAVVLALSMILVSPANQTSAADMTHQVTNVGNRSFTVSWVTDVTEIGSVNYGTSTSNLDNTAYDERGQATEDDTHHVTITGLTASTPYYYEIVSGGTTYNNSGAPYEITIGPGLDFKMPDPITGTAYKEGGVTAAEGTIVYVSIDTSQILSVLVDSSGAWGLDIAPIRAADYQSYYAHSDSDDITIEAQGGADGTASQVVTIATAKAGEPAMTLATALTASFSADVAAASVGETIQFTNATSGGTPDYTYEWDFDNDGTVDSIEASPTHAYTSTGTYTVSLTVTDSETSTDTETKTDYISVAEELVAGFSADVTAASVGGTIQFTDATTGGAPDYTYEWDFNNDGTVDNTEASPTHAYTSTGTYTVSLTVTDSQARTNTETKTDYINVAEELVAGFSADLTAADTGDTIQFTNATTGGATPYTYEWDFNNDGTVDSIEASPTHIYTTAGTYTVSLTVTDSQARTDTETKTDYINIIAELVADFSADATVANVDGTIQFTDATTGGTPDYTYEWDFDNDGTVDNTEASPSHAYTSIGTYTVSLTVTDSQARTDTETKTSYINVAEGLVADFSADVTIADVGDVIQFTNAAAGGTPDYSYEWDFDNDGTVDNTEANPSHTYTSAGTYSVSLTVTDSQARTYTKTKTDYINAAEELVAGFSADVTASEVGAVIQFTDATSGGSIPYTYEWDFNSDGTVDSIEANPTHIYTTAGTYSVGLTVTDSVARADTETKTDYINAAAVGIPHQVTNVGNISLAITWVTNTTETGCVNYGVNASSLSSTAYDDRGQMTEDDTHHVTITGLTADTPYYYEIISGGVTYNNVGVPYEITTGPILDFMMPDPITGTVHKADGVTAAEGTIVYVSIGTSQVLSALVDSSGAWGLDIAAIRAADYQSYYTHSDDDNGSFRADGGADGMAIQTATIATAKSGALTIALTPTPIADFSADVTAADTGDLIQFTDAATDGVAPYTYEWDFNNDGTVDSTEANPVHTYNSAGTYSVSLTVTDSLGRADTETKTSYIIITAAPSGDSDIYVPPPVVVEEVSPELTASELEGMNAEEAADILEETTATRAADVIEEIATDKAADIIEAVTTTKAADIIEAVTTTKAADIIDEVSTTKADDNIAYYYTDLTR